MAFLKQNSILIISGAVVLVSLGLAVAGIVSMSSIQEEMAKSTNLIGRIGRLERDPKNAEMIEAAKARGEEVRSNWEKMKGVIRQAGKYTPLREDVFPDKQTVDSGFKFRVAYKAAIGELLDRLKAGTPPSQTEIAEYDALIKQEQAADKEKGGSGGAAAGGSALGSRQPNKADLPLEERAKIDAPMRAAITKARDISCYADASTFSISEPLWKGEMDPQLQEMWDAQVDLWIQQDLVEAIAGINDQAAAEIKAGGGKPWVGNLPVKDVLGVTIVQDIAEEEAKRGRGNMAPGGNRPDPPGSYDLSITHRTSDATYRVNQVTLTIVADARFLPKVIEAICQGKFYVPISINYDYIPHEGDLTGKIYGPDPIVRAYIDLEHYLFVGEDSGEGNSYGVFSLAPQAILEQWGLSR